MVARSDADASFDLLLRALADRTRRTLLDRLRDAPGPTLTELLAGLPQSRQALSKHLALLEDAGLVVPVWRGREKRHYLNPAPLQQLPGRWVTRSAQQDAAALAALRSALPGSPDGMAPVAPPATPAPARAVKPRRGRRPSAGADDPVAALLRQPPSARLQGQPVLSAAALGDARDYLAATLAALQALGRVLPVEGGRERPAAGGFSLVEHLWHLADIEALGWRVRFERILAEPRPRLAGVDGDRLALERRYQDRAWRPALRQFVAERRRSLAALARFDEATLRLPLHFAGERSRAGGVVAAAVAHDLDHRPAMAALWQAAARPAPTTRSRRS